MHAFVSMLQDFGSQPCLHSRVTEESMCVNFLLCRLLFFLTHSSSDISNACIICYRFEHLPNVSDPFVEYVMTEKGYFDDEAFLAYIKFMVKHIPKDGRWRLLILDGYGAHTMSYETLQVFVNINILFCEY